MTGKRLIEEFGLDSPEDAEGEEVGLAQNSQFKIAFMNLMLTAKDGIPAQIPSVPYMYIGSIGSAYNLKALCSAGITHILCLSSVIKMRFQESIVYRRIPMKDNPSYDFASDLPACLSFIQSARDSGGRVLVHCFQGKSRSAAVCCAVMMQELHLSRDDVLDLLREVRPIASPNTGFMATLQSLSAANAATAT